MVASRHMWGNEAFRLAPQRRVDRQRLRFSHIERSATDSSFRERVGKRLAFNGVAAARVDDDGVRFERCDAFRIEQVVRCRSRWHAHGDHIGVLQHVVEGIETDHMIDARRFDGGITANADGCHSDVFAESCEV